MLLTKSCHAKDNVFKRKTIKMATLNHYRMTEIAQIADKNEGRLTININILTPTLIEKRWINAVLQDSVKFGLSKVEIDQYRFPGRTSALIKNLEIGPNSTLNQLEVLSGDFRIDREAPDTLIFCTSMTRRTDDWRGIFPDYDDAWSMHRSGAHKFAQSLAESLAKLLLSGDTSLLGDCEPAEGVQIHLRHEPVTYIERQINILESDPKDVNDVFSLMDLMAFIKPRSFSHEKEYRFMLMLTRNGMILPLKKDFVILDLTDQDLGYLI